MLEVFTGKSIVSRLNPNYDPKKTSGVETPNQSKSKVIIAGKGTVELDSLEIAKTFITKNVTKAMKEPKRRDDSGILLTLALETLINS